MLRLLWELTWASTTENKLDHQYYPLSDDFTPLQNIYLYTIAFRKAIPLGALQPLDKAKVYKTSQTLGLAMELEEIESRIERLQGVLPIRLSRLDLPITWV
jgi:hypothetical protein